MAKTNPNGANQHKPDPRQTLFLKYYLDKKSETFSDCYNSAIKAKFSEKYAKVLVAQMPTWLSDTLKTEDIVEQAENNLRSFLSDEEEDKRIKSDMTKFALKGLAKNKYSERTEHTGKDGEEIIIKQVNYGNNNSV